MSWRSGIGGPVALRWWLSLLIVVGSSLPVSAMAPDRMTAGGTAAVAVVVDGETLVLIDGRTVRLAEMRAPGDRSGDPVRRYARQAQAALRTFAEGRAVALRFGGAREDRHGRVLAHLIRDDGIWLQKQLISEGLALAWSAPDNRAAAIELLAAERAAQAARRGLWQAPGDLVRTAADAGHAWGTIKLIEGTVLRADRIGATVFLNFGDAWRSDFTIRIEAPDLRRFRQAGLDPLAYRGRAIRVRGVLTRRNGPQIEVTHPEQIEVLAEEPPDRQ